MSSKVKLSQVPCGTIFRHKECGVHIKLAYCPGAPTQAVAYADVKAMDVGNGQITTFRPTTYVEMLGKVLSLMAEVVITKEHSWGWGHDYVEWYKCPNCGGECVGAKSKFCCTCGAKIIWSLEERKG